MFFQSPVSQAVERMIELHDYIFFFLVLIFSFVLWFFFNILSDFGDFDHELHIADLIEKENSYSKTYNLTHLGAIEVIWTIIPVFILTAIAVPSFQLLYALDVVSQPLLTLKCIGNQWYWSYECFYRGQFFEPDTRNSILIAIDKNKFLGIRQSLIEQELLISKFIGRKDEARITRNVAFAKRVPSRLPQFRNVDMTPLILYYRDYSDSIFALNDYAQANLSSAITGSSRATVRIPVFKTFMFTTKSVTEMIDDYTLPFKHFLSQWFKKIKAERPMSFKFDSFMIDVDELSLGQFRFIRS